MGAKRIKLSHVQDEVAACDRWLSTAERKNVINHFQMCDLLSVSVNTTSAPSATLLTATAAARIHSLH